MYCSECGKEIANNSKFCPKCGKEIKNEESKENIIQTKARPIDRKKYSRVSLHRGHLRQENNDSNIMKIIALVIGIIGGIFGIMVGNQVMAFGSGLEIFEIEGSETLVSLGLQSIIFAIIGLIGGLFSISRPGIASILMALASILGLIFLSFTNLPSILFGTASLLAVIGWSNEQ